MRIRARLTDWHEFAKSAATNLGAVALSLVGFSDGKPWEKLVFAAFGLGSGALFLWEIVESWRFIEPQAVRRRIHLVFQRIAIDVFPKLDDLQITLFIPDGNDDAAELVAIVRRHHDKPKSHRPSTVSFPTSGSSNIAAAWATPGRWVSYSLHAPDDRKDRARAALAIAYKLRMEPKLAAKLSDRTLLSVAMLADVGLAHPTKPTEAIGLVSFNTTTQGGLVLDALQQQKVASYLEVVAMMVAPP